MDVAICFVYVRQERLKLLMKFSWIIQMKFLVLFCIAITFDVKATVYILYKHEMEDGVSKPYLLHILDQDFLGSYPRVIFKFDLQDSSAYWH